MSNTEGEVPIFRPPKPVPTNDDLFTFAQDINRYFRKNGIPVDGVLVVQKDYQPVDEYDPTIMITWRRASNDIFALDLQYLWLLGPQGLTDQARHARDFFDVRNPGAPVHWDTYKNPPPVPVAGVPASSQVGEEIPGQPGFYYVADVFESGKVPKGGTVYRDPRGRGSFVWIEGMFGGKWQKLG